ncbi:efflux RND transporter permease subunit [Actinomadura vinacea]|uniref:Efflux RND transporter permease subunit n=1 Tax=Actinomadura vinacea TaxID=115336 RepID=A0ABN3K1F2_9ACTN
MSWLSKAGLAHRKLVLLITIGVLALGGYLIPTLKQQLLPSLSFPAVAVTAAYPGASPQVVEQQVVQPIEDAVKGTDGLETMSSTSRQGGATVQLQFAFGTDTGDLAAQVRQELDKIGERLPEDVEPQVVTGSTDDMPTLTLAATAGADPRVLADRLARVAVPELEAVDGVNEAAVSGERARVVQVVPDQARLKSRGLGTAAITGALEAAGTTLPAGAVESGGKSLSVQVGGPIGAVDQLKDLWLTPGAQAPGGQAPGGQRPGGQGAGAQAPGGAAAQGAAVRLGDVASVQVTDSEATSLTRTNGKESLGVSITLDPDGSSSSVSDDVRALLPELERKLGGAKLTVVTDSGPAVSEAVAGLVEEGLLGLVMAVLVIVLFLRSARSTLVTAISIPLSLVIALIALKIGDHSLNMLTLGALTIAVGRVVDDSIVVLENIKRHLGYGEDRTTAIRTAVAEVAGAVTASTLTTVAVFLPMALVGGAVGQLFGPFSITVTVAMLASLVVSLTVIPILAYWFLKPPATGGDPDGFRRRVEEEERNGLLQRAYVPVIAFATRRRKSVLAGSAAVLIGTVALAGGLKTSFIGGPGSESLTITQKLAAGSSLGATDAAAEKVEGVLAATRGVESYQVTIGSQGGLMGAGTGVDSASYTVALKDGTDAEALKKTLDGRLRALSGAGTLTVADGGGGFGGSEDIQVQVHGTDDSVLAAATRQIEQALKGVPEVTGVTSDLSESTPQFVIRADGGKAAAAGLTDMTIAQAVTQAVRGQTVTTVPLGGDDTDVTVRTTTTAPRTAAELRGLDVPTATGGTVELGDVATVTQQDGPVERARVDGDRTVTVTATPVGDDTGAASGAVTEALDRLDLPEGAEHSLGGVTADQDEAFAQLGLALLAAILIVFMLLVATFGSIRQTLVLLVSIPFAATGAILLLRVTGVPLGVAAMVGLLMLIGIVVTNAIVLVDLINQYRKAGMGITEAVTEGGRRRLRPILMTALATIFALLPMALGVTGSGGFISQPLAVVVIGGLFSSTVLSLILIPTLYTMVETRRERRQAGKAAADRPADPAPAGDRGKELDPVG